MLIHILNLAAEPRKYYAYLPLDALPYIKLLLNQERHLEQILTHVVGLPVFYK